MSNQNVKNMLHLLKTYNFTQNFNEFHQEIKQNISKLQQSIDEVKSIDSKLSEKEKSALVSSVLNKIINKETVTFQVFKFHSLKNFISLFIKEYQDFFSFQEDTLLFKVFTNAETLSEEEKTEKELLNYLEVFPTSKQLLSLNNDLLSLAKEYENFFIETNEEVGFTKKTKEIAKYFEKDHKILSFFLSLGVPDDNKLETYKKFIDLYNGGFLYKHFDDQFFSFLALIYNINECIKMIAYISPIMIVKDH